MHRAEGRKEQVKYWEYVLLLTLAASQRQMLSDAVWVEGSGQQGSKQASQPARTPASKPAWHQGMPWC